MFPGPILFLRIQVS